MLPTAWAAQEGAAPRSAYHTSRSTSPRSSTRSRMVAASLNVTVSSPRKATPSAVALPRMTPSAAPAAA